MRATRIINTPHAITASFMTYACPIIESHRNAPVRERTGIVKIATISLIVQLTMHLNETSSDMRRMIVS
jgi:hypothetical protein